MITKDIIKIEEEITLLSMYNRLLDVHDPSDHLVLERNYSRLMELSVRIDILRKELHKRDMKLRLRII